MVRVFFPARPHGLYYIYGDCRRNEGIAYAHSLIKDNYPNYILTGQCNNTIHRACKDLGINKNFTTHDCRRYAATKVAFEGMSTPAMQMAFGWKDRDTAEKYIQVAAATKEHQKMLVNVLN